MEGESCWKSGGGRTRLYTWPRVGLADEASSHAVPVSEITGPLKTDGVIHRHLFYHKWQPKRHHHGTTSCQKRLLRNGTQGP
jgi:hypothetical protein